MPVWPLERAGPQHPNAPHRGSRLDVRVSRLLAGTVQQAPGGPSRLQGGSRPPRTPGSWGAWAQVQQYSIQDLRSALDKADGKAPGPNHVEACFIKALPAPVQ